MSEQHPALDGEPEYEIARRSPDGAEGHHWLRDLVYRILPGHHFDPDAMDHTANLAGAAQAAIQAGVRPKGMPFFVGVRPHETAADNVVLTYAVPVVPAVTDTDPGSTVTPTQITLAAQAQEPDGAEQTPEPAPAPQQEAQPEPTTATAGPENLNPPPAPEIEPGLLQ